MSIARVVHRGGDTRRGIGHVAPAQSRQHVGIGGLQAEGDPVDPGPAIRGQVLLVRVLGIALDGHLGVSGAGYGGQDAAERLGVQARRGAASEEDTGGGDEVTRQR